jgi:uncharacterized protein
LPFELTIDPLFYSVAAFGVILVGFSKAGFGGGIGFLGVVAMSVVATPIQAVAVMLPVLCVIDPLGSWSYRKSWDRRCMKVLMIGGTIGTVVGALTFSLLNDSFIRLLVGVLTMLFLADRAYGQARKAERKTPGNAAGVILGGLGGFTSFVIHAGAPPTTMYLLPQRLDKSVYVGTIAIYFFALNYMKIGPYIWLGLFTYENLLTSLALMPFAPVGIWLGLRFHRRISERWFYRVSYGFMLVAGIKLIFDGTRAIVAP